MRSHPPPRRSTPVPTPGRASTGPLVVTGDAVLRDRILLLCAAAGVTAESFDAVDGARPHWLSAACVLLGPDAAGRAAADSPPVRRRDVAIVCDHDAASIWRDAVAVGAERVLVLPAAQDDLVGWLADTVEGSGRAVTIGVTGARGGAGASTFAASLALCAARRSDVCLVDADPLAGGLELVLGSEDAPGLRWPDASFTEGRIGASSLRDALPAHRGVTVLSWPRGRADPLSATAMRAMLGAAVRSFEHIVIDLPRAVDAAAAEALASCDHVLIVATNDVRSVAAISSMLPQLSRRALELSVVVRSRPSAALTPDDVVASTGLDLAGVVPTRRSIRRAVDEGFGPPRRGAFINGCREILDRLTDRTAA